MCLTVAYEGATPVWHRRGGGDPLPPFTTRIHGSSNQIIDMLLFRCGGVVAHGWVIVELVALAGRKKVNGEVKALIQMEDVH